MHPRTTLSIIACAIATACPLSAFSAKPASHLDLFPQADVALLPSPFLDSLELATKYVLQHDPDRLLAPFLSDAGLTPKAERYGNWEGSGLGGHTAGHYLSALATLWAATGESVYTERLDYMLSELARCQDAHGNGYVGGVPNSKNVWGKVAAGEIEANRFGLNGAWVPWYNLHKLYAGLRDVWVITGNEQAKTILLKLTDWTYDLTEKLDDETMQRMLYAEHGGMNEVFADLYKRIGDERYLRLALRFSDKEILEPMERGEDMLTGYHANTQIPKVVGFQEIALASDHDHYGEAATFFWETVVNKRSIAFGGNSVREHFNAVDDFGPMLESREGPESCNTGNMMRLTEQLFLGEPSAKLGDYYERSLFNHILSLQHPKTGGFVYFTPIRPRHYRVYSVAEDAFWCCVGSGMENPGRYNEFIYARRGADELYVNLFIPSELKWRASNGLVLRQETEFPNTPSTKLTVAALDKPTKLALRIRRPEWTDDGFAIRVNGKPAKANVSANGYATIDRKWRKGDVVEIDLPMTVRVEQLPDGSDYFAFLYGPIVLAAKTSESDTPGLFAGDGRMDHIAPGPYLPLDKAPTIVGDPDSLASRAQPIAGKPLHFYLAGDVRPAPSAPFTLEPFNGIHESRYMIYWRALPEADYEKVMADLAIEEARKAELAARTVDTVAPGEQQTEVEHDFKDAQSRSGALLGRRYRESSQWFEYTLDTRGSRNLEIAVTYFGSEWGKACSVLVNGAEIGTLNASGGQPEKFVEATFAVPADALENAKDGRITVRIAARDNRPTPNIFGIALRKTE